LKTIPVADPIKLNNIKIKKKATWRECKTCWIFSDILVVFTALVVFIAEIKKKNIKRLKFFLKS